MSFIFVETDDDVTSRAQKKIVADIKDAFNEAGALASDGLAVTFYNLNKTFWVDGTPAKVKAPDALGKNGPKKNKFDRILINIVDEVALAQSVQSVIAKLLANKLVKSVGVPLHFAEVSFATFAENPYSKYNGGISMADEDFMDKIKAIALSQPKNIAPN